MTSLVLKSIDLQQKSNAAAHNTSDYVSKVPIVRRGLPMKVTLAFSRALQSTESLALVMETGPSPSASTNTRIVMPVSSSRRNDTWSATLESSSAGTMTVSINIPVNASIGPYKITAQITSAGRTSTNDVGRCSVLFNAWASGDEAYMSNDAERKEYVLNETGLVFYGSAGFPSSSAWDYGHFEDGVVDICFKLLQESPEYKADPATHISKCNDPVYISRILSAMVNSQDDRGVIVGNWSGDYSGGENPSSWSGSVALLQRWSQSGPVRYGQCWVYAGVLCTTLRCLGLAARLITNFESAHDTNNNLIIEQYLDAYGRSIGSPDSVWNFHAWVECWFRRKDLGSTYDGWQILDATPQEPSGGSYRLGPTSQKAVKLGDVNLPFDGPFVLAEVNADEIYYGRRNDGTFSILYTDTRKVGQYISTKAVGNFSRQDVTDQYKFPEGSKEERDSLHKAQGLTARSDRVMLASRRLNATAARVVEDKPPIQEAPKPEIIGTFKLSGELQVGQDFTVTLNLKNPTSSKKQVNAKWTLTAIVYNRTPVKEILSDSQSVTLAPNEEKVIEITVLYPQYEKALTPDNMIRASAVCVEENGGSLLVDKVITLKNPPLQITAPERVTWGKSATLGIVFTNPISEDIKNCVVTLQGSGILKKTLKVPLPDLKANQRIRAEAEVTPYRNGKRVVIAGFSCDKFSDVKGYQTVDVMAA
ncbi:protein-glutamine gamma-glutamyltransferase E [Xenopus tropicalis]|uniref:protein-glutamine gamma-glutamyltransferase n=1 Tax=Xenopus tropicalis TaxID=8364 RepID=F6YIE1_XENTR|nr:protein-glutamine gamma-glutamyltransferase E [Xenopus tropicalis]